MFAFAQLDVPLHLLKRIPIDHGPDVGIWMVRMPDLERCDRLRQTRHQSFVDVVDGDQSGQGRTFLTLETKGRLDDAEDRFVEIGVGIDDHRILPTHFADHFFQVSLIPVRDCGGSPR